MRPIYLVAAAALGLAAFSSLSFSPASAAPAGAPAEESPFRIGDGRTLAFTVQGGFQTSPGRATHDALARAQEQIVEHLRQQEPPVRWAPTPEFIQKRLVKRSSEEESNTVVDPDLQKVVGTLYRVKLDVEVGPDDQREILRQDRALRGKDRMFLLGRILAGLVVALAAVAAYVRIDEWTKGYLTGGLRLTAVGVVVAVAAALILA
jgi:hypothetical protein